MRCGYFDAGTCRSCDLMGTDVAAQVAGKVGHCRGLLGPWPRARWLEPFQGPAEAFRTKAKMVVGGTVDAPTLGILDAGRRGVDLRGCGVLTTGIRDVLDPLAAFVTRCRATPYDVPARRGELKHLLLLEAPSGALAVRFVLRSREAVPRLRKHLPWLLEALPRVQVVSVNLQPEHKAVIEGDVEVPLTPGQALPLGLPDVVLHARPGAFVQTNTVVAAALYAQVAAWVDGLAPRRVWDLYCGLGGFALHVAAPGRQVVGVEASGPAVQGARDAAAAAGSSARFVTDDASTWAAAQGGDPPDVVVVNPPRRGLGERLCAWLEGCDVPAVVYSSCHAVTLAADLARMPSLEPREVRLFDMFPQTSHYETAVLLTRR